MKTPFIPALNFGLLVAAALLAGCGRQSDESHDHDPGHDRDHDHDPDHAGGAHEEHRDGKGEGGEAGHEHAHGAASSGASFQAGKGILLSEETRKLLGLEVAEVAPRKLEHQLRFTVQVFGEKHRHLVNPEDHTGCDVHGSGFVSPEVIGAIKVGHPVLVMRDTNRPIGGVVLAVQKALALGETEVVVGFSNATGALRSGEFVPARISLPRADEVLAIPFSALLRGAEGTFVYVVKGDACQRTAVKVRAEADGWVEIVEGLSRGVQVVTRPVETLWLIELRATKGGGHSH